MSKNGAHECHILRELREKVDISGRGWLFGEDGLLPRGGGEACVWEEDYVGDPPTSM